MVEDAGWDRSWDGSKSGLLRTYGRNNMLPPNAGSSPSVIEVDSGLEDALSPALSRRVESTVTVLPFRPAKLCPSLCPDILEMESQARPAAFDEAGGALNRVAEVLGDLEGFLPSFVRNVVNIGRPFLSGLGVLEVFFGGTGSAGVEYGLGKGSESN